MKHRKAFTLVEISICVLLGAMVVFTLIRMFSGGVKSSAKGSAHLTNIQAASILLSQIDTDFRKTVDILYPQSGNVDPSLNIKLQAQEGFTGTIDSVSIIYEAAASGKGVKRIWDDNSGPSEHVFCRNLSTDISFRRMEFPNGTLGLWAKLKTKNPGGVEEFVVERFFNCLSQQQNSYLKGWNW